MIDQHVLDGMILARQVARNSTCKRRKIGAVLFRYKSYHVGYNSPGIPCHICTRESGVCPAVHAEVGAIIRLLQTDTRNQSTTLFVWSEIPCIACLSLINKVGFVHAIYCLTPESYITEYDNLRTAELSHRYDYAKDLGLLVIELDKDDVLYGGSLCPS